MAAYVLRTPSAVVNKALHKNGKGELTLFIQQNIELKQFGTIDSSESLPWCKAGHGVKQYIPRKVVRWREGVWDSQT